MHNVIKVIIFISVVTFALNEFPDNVTYVAHIKTDLCCTATVAVYLKNF